MADEATITLQIESATVTAATGDTTVKVRIALSRAYDDDRGQDWRVQVELPDAALKTEERYSDAQRAMDDAQAIARHVLAAYLRKAEAESNIGDLLDGWQHVDQPREVTG